MVCSDGRRAKYLHETHAAVSNRSGGKAAPEMTCEVCLADEGGFLRHSCGTGWRGGPPCQHTVSTAPRPCLLGAEC